MQLLSYRLISAAHMRSYSLNVLKQAIIRDLNTDLQVYRVTCVPAVLKCLDAVLQLEHLTAA